ncbi:MerR family transcriptional regulator [Amycolatopsis nigrescens]|uniref:MerR family transcriptional regulator n=1 Tax=Amycolatopsis nigrescens TaxID=381445 RepID=UPI00058ECFFE|nr:MerR family transcriptional regulator [Amycolatopsis nigrescens]
MSSHGPTGDELIGIGETAARFGLAGSTLRYWEERGLISPAERRGRWRRYGPRELHRIGLIQLWRDTGLMSLDEIAAVLAGTVRDRTWRSVVLGRLEMIEEQQRRLAAAKEHLEHFLTCPDEHPADNCPVLREMTDVRLARQSA